MQDGSTPYAFMSSEAFEMQCSLQLKKEKKKKKCCEKFKKKKGKICKKCPINLA